VQQNIVAVADPSPSIANRIRPTFKLRIPVKRAPAPFKAFALVTIIASLIATSACSYSRTQVTLLGTPAPAKAATFEPAILDRLPQEKVLVVAEATKTYRDISWAKDACRDLGCDAAVIIGRRPRQVANLFQMDATSGGSSGAAAPQTHTEYDDYLYQFVVLP
jgi:hypothetical protein